ncbi:hypothetical protein HDU82_000495 [Entophlyctis luteolus]|nr:hypothetical protein HDU82_000495 [Entophlyctis luteolus]
MLCAHLPSSPTPPPEFHRGVFKDECTQCFESQVGAPGDSEGGVDVCLMCFNGACSELANDHSRSHFRNFNHPLVLNIKRVKKDSAEEKDAQTPPPLKKIAIQAEPNEAEKFDFITSVKCFVCGDVATEASPNLAALLKSVVEATSSQKKSDIQAWEEVITDCEHTRNLVQTAAKKLEPSSLACCNSCDLKQNLWLCLTCGNLGCGRQQVGGLGGNGHGLAHFDESLHPVSVKLGTITPEGGADIYCYICNEERLDPLLGNHLKVFGINMEVQEKTEKSLTELQLEQNIKFDFSMTTEDGKELTPLFGPGYTGLKNLGNTCYMASVLQVLFSLSAFEDRYLGPGQHHISICKDKAPNCFHCQMAKIAHGLLSGAYSLPIGDDKGQDGISPGMFKTLTSRGHPEFSTMRQQDAQEYLSHILTLIEQKERAGGKDPSKTFKFSMEQRLQCIECRSVRYVKEPATEALQVPVPATENDGADVTIGFDNCLGKLFGDELRDFNCPKCGKKTSLICSTRFSSYPEVLVLPMSRFIQGSDYIMKKLNVQISAPLEMSLEEYRSNGAQIGEELFPEETESKSEPVFDASAMEQLMGMGFSDLRSKKALHFTGNNGAEVAMNWLFEHMEDADIDDPMDFTSAGPSKDESVDYSMFVDMGFTIAQAKKAMSQTNNSVERAVDWLFSHAGEEMVVDEPTSSDSATAPQSASSKYELVAFISHRGTSAHCGHYVAHVKKEGRWVLFNDNKVAEVPDILKAVGEAYIYFYKSV